jgi:hypothetical protein
MTDHGDGTATLSGTPTAAGTFTVHFTATNSRGVATQDLTISISNPPPTGGVEVGGGAVATSDYVSLVPERLLDTRPTSQIGYTGDKPAAGAIVKLKVVGVGTSNVPAGSKAVVLNVTGTEAAANGYVTVWPCGAPQPTASNLNLVVGANIPNLVISQIGDDGSVCIYTQNSLHLVADINGYMPPTSQYTSVVPERLLDTRAATSVGYSGAKPVAGQTIELTVVGAGSTQVPADASAVVLNVTGTEAEADGFVTVWPCGAPQPLASNLNLEAGKDRPNLVISQIGADGKVCIYTQNPAHLIADVNGYLPAGAGYVPMVPARILETRAAGQTGYSGDKPAPGAIITLHVAGAGVPAVPADAAAVVLNVTGTEATADGYVTIWPCGAPQPTASNLNLTKGSTAPNLVIAQVGEGGNVCIYTQSGAHLIADLAGYWPAG